MSVARKKLVVLQYLQQQVVCCSFFFKFVEAKMVDCLHQYFEMCGGFGPTMNIWYKGQMALGESWWILALADGMWLANDRAFLCPLVATSRRNSQINRWMAARTPGVPSLKVRKCVLLPFFFSKVFSYGPMMDPMYACRLVKKETMCDPTVLFS